MLPPIKHDHVTNTGEACVPFQAISVYSLLAQIAVNLYILDENPRVEGSIILTCTQSLYVTFRIIFSVLKLHSLFSSCLSSICNLCKLFPSVPLQQQVFF